MASLVAAASAWIEGASSDDYPGYAQIIAALQQQTFDSILTDGGAWVGSPKEILAQAQAYQEQTNGFEMASLQVNFDTLPIAEARRSVELFAREVMPRL